VRIVSTRQTDVRFSARRVRIPHGSSLVCFSCSWSLVGCVQLQRTRRYKTSSRKFRVTNSDNCVREESCNSADCLLWNASIGQSATGCGHKLLQFVTDCNLFLRI
jgi:hypothetical protein